MQQKEDLKRRALKWAAVGCVLAGFTMSAAATTSYAADTPKQGKKPNILVIWGDDIGTWNISHNNRGMMGYQTPNIDRLGKEGVCTSPTTMASRAVPLVALPWLAAASPSAPA